MDWRFLIACFVVLGLGVSALHGLRGLGVLPEWAIAASLAGFGFVLMGTKRWLDRRRGVGHE
jgi:hypothetical protein